jgi:hypothetical protein
VPWSAMCGSRDVMPDATFGHCASGSPPPPESVRDAMSADLACAVDLGNGVILFGLEPAVATAWEQPLACLPGPDR